MFKPQIAMWGFMTGALFCTLVPVTHKDLPTPTKIFTLVTGLACCLEAKKLESIVKDYEEEVRHTSALRLDLKKQERASEYAKELSLILGEPAPATYVEPTPEIESVPNLDTPTYTDYNPSLKTISQDLTFRACAPEAQSELKAWMSTEFAIRSKVVVASTGSGKTSFLRWVYQTSCQQVQTYLFDPHLHANHLDKEQPIWCKTIEEDLQYICHAPSQMLTVIRTLDKEVQDRLAGKSKDKTPIHLIVDEGDARFFEDNEQLGQMLSKFVVSIANEARKTGISLTYVTHTFKKSKTGIDSADLEQITWVCLGNILGAANIRWPSDFDYKSLRSQQQMLQNTVDPETARAFVIRHAHLGNFKTTVELVEKTDYENVL